MAIAVEKRLQDVGYRLLGDDGSIDKLFIDILRTKNARYLKAIPFLIYRYGLNASALQKKLNPDEEALFSIILNFTARIFKESNIEKNIDFGRESKGKNHPSEFNYSEFKEEFELQLRNDSRPNLLIDTQKIDKERNLQFALSQLFTKKERVIIRSLQEDKPVSKTDYEYYSRKTKKKLRSIITLHDFALGISEKSPKLEEKVNEIEILKKIAGKSKLSEKDAMELGIKINGNIARRFQDK